MSADAPPDALARRLTGWVFNGSVLAAVGGLAMATAIILATGHNPLEAFAAAYRQVFGDVYRISTAISWSLPLLIAGLGVAISFRAGIYNLGGEGQIYLGAMAAAVVGYQLGPLFWPLHVGVCLIAAGACGALIAYALGLLRTRFGVDEVLSTLMSNYVVVLFTQYLATYPFRDPTRRNASTPLTQATAHLPTLVPTTDLTVGVFLVVALVLLLYWLLQRTRLGYELKMVGLSPGFARATAIRMERTQLIAMALSGFVAGVAGGFLVVATQHRFWASIGLGLGWDAILLALIANSHPVALVGWALFYSAMNNGALGMEQATGVPSELSQVVLASAILAIAAKRGLGETLRRLLASRPALVRAAQPARLQEGTDRSG